MLITAVQRHTEVWSEVHSFGYCYLVIDVDNSGSEAHRGLVKCGARNLNFGVKYIVLVSVI